MMKQSIVDRLNEIQQSLDADQCIDHFIASKAQFIRFMDSLPDVDSAYPLIGADNEGYVVCEWRNIDQITLITIHFHEDESVHGVVITDCAYLPFKNTIDGILQDLF